MTIQRAATAVVLALALVAAGCDGDDGDDESGASTTTTRPATTTSGTPGERCDVTATDTARAAPQGGPLFLTDLTHEASRPCEEVAFVFEDVPERAVAGYEIGYAPGPFADASGLTTPVEGEVFLRVILMNGTTADLSGEEPRVADINPVVDPSSEVVVDIEQISDFEGQSEWVIGLQERVGFRVGTDGDRLVVELAKP